MPSYNNVQTTSAYKEFRFPPTLRVTLAVANAPILALFAYVLDDGWIAWQAHPFDPNERDLANGTVWTWDAEKDFGAKAIVGVQVKSEIAGTPALVTIHAGS